jgi:two-component system NtrC family sensor kinase
MPVPRQNKKIPLRSTKIGDFRKLSRQILQLGKLEEPKVEFLQRLLKVILDHSNCDEAEIWTVEDARCSWYRISSLHDESFKVGTLKGKENWMEDTVEDAPDRDDREMLGFAVLNGQCSTDLEYITENGNLWITDTNATLKVPVVDNGKFIHIKLDGEFKSILIIQLSFGDQKIGILQLKHKEKDYFNKEQIEFYEGIAETLGVAVAYQNVQSALRERVKELTCLYGISQIARRPDLALEGILQKIVNLIPPGWQYPEITQGRIVLDGKIYQTTTFVDSKWKQTADIYVKGNKRGFVHVVYSRQKPTLDEGPFLKEERKLIAAIARQVAIIVEHREDMVEKARLQEQLRHADRLATIGQLSAGVAHELNEPLANILGFTQLILKDPNLPEQIKSDLDKIVNSCLFARDVIQKLLIFSRQATFHKSTINLNDVVESGLSFFKSRLEKNAIELHRTFDPDLPEIVADQAQITQVLINLVVNAIQAMPGGGRLYVGTKREVDNVLLIVADTGIGMSEEVKKQIFLPFFTTKDVDQGTGLGLAVVHGIIISHKGKMEVESEVGKGSRFTVKLPIDNEFLEDSV